MYQIEQYQAQGIKIDTNQQQNEEQESKVPGKEQDPDLHYFSEKLLEENECLRKKILNLEETSRILKNQLEAEKQLLRELQ